MQLSLRSRLSLFFAFIGLTSILSISFLANFQLEWQFIQHTIRTREQENLYILEQIEDHYLGNNLWKIDEIENIGVRTLEEGKIIHLTGTSGATVWNAREHNSGLCQEMIQRMTEKMSKRYATEEQGFTSKEYEVLSDGDVVGYLNMEYFGPFYFSDTELFFIDTINRILIYVSIAIIIASVILGAIIARRISKPISEAITAAEGIARGNYTVPATEKSNTFEVENLRVTMNEVSRVLKSKETLRKRLTSDVAHELRTPLATLQSHLEAMIDGVWDASKERLTSIHEEIIRISGLVKDLETLSRFDAESIVLNKTRFDVFELMQNVVQLHFDQFRNKGIELKAAGELVRIEGDRDKLMQVLVNLISNAFKYTSPGGSVTLEAFPRDSTCFVQVRDTGAGIPADDLPFIFERFYRVDQSRTRTTGGSGIGLTIAREIVLAHNGEIHAESDPGRETVFTISLPL